MVLSDGNSMTNLQAIDNQYENPISVGILNAPDSDSDGIRNGLMNAPQHLLEQASMHPVVVTPN